MSTYSAEQIRVGGKVSDDELVLFLRYNIWISGTMLGTDKKQCIKSCTITETVDGADSASFVIADPDFLFIEDNIFVEENTVRIMLGWDVSEYRVDFHGYISSVDINFGTDGVPILTVTCMDNTHRMNREKKDETFTNCTSADVVKRKCAEYGFKCVIDSDYQFTVQETITQSQQTDIEFITRLAGEEVYPFTARLVGDTFYYVKIGKLETPKMTLTYQKYPYTITSFQPRINKEVKQVAISNSTIDTSTKDISTTTSSGSSGSTGGTTTEGSVDDSFSDNPENKDSYNEDSTPSSSTTPTQSKAPTHTYNPQTRTWS